MCGSRLSVMAASQNSEVAQRPGAALEVGVDAGDEAPLQLAAVQLSHCMWGLHAWGPRGSDPTAGEVTAADPVPDAGLLFVALRESNFQHRSRCSAESVRSTAIAGWC